MNMKKLLSAAAVIMAAAAVLAACGGSSGSSAPAPTAITTTQQGAQAASAGTLTVSDIVGGTVSISGDLNNQMPAKRLNGNGRLAKVFNRSMTRLRKAKKAVSVNKATNTVSCFDGGSMTETFPDTQTLPFIISISYSNCKENGMLTNGTMSINVTSQTSISLSDKTTVTTYTDTTYTTVESIDTFNETLSMTVGAGNTVTLSINGTESKEDKILNTKESETLNITFTGTDNTDYSAGNLDINGEPITGSISMTLNGTASSSFTSGGTVTESSSESFTNLKVVAQWDGNAGTETTSINGTFSSQLTPDDPCVEGTYTFKTVTPVTFDSNSMTYTAGEIQINGTVVVKFTPSGVQVSVDGGTTFDTYDLSVLCPTL